MSEEELAGIVDKMQEVNPMLGFRGCRLGIAFPEITEMQVRARVGVGVWGWACGCLCWGDVGGRVGVWVCVWRCVCACVRCGWVGGYVGDLHAI